MNYIQGTIGHRYFRKTHKSGNIKWYVNAEFSVHKDMRSHTGGFMNMGTWGVYVQSSKKKLNTKSSTEADLVGVDNVLTQIIWTQ